MQAGAHEGAQAEAPQALGAQAAALQEGAQADALQEGAQAWAEQPFAFFAFLLFFFAFVAPQAEQP
ncbi:MAG: hypothetical protein HC843_11790 [Sphingomonadales bacterium]|nr:hypothetical protein [Sphingomonadales bacterium]